MKPIFLSLILLSSLGVTTRAADTGFFDSKVLPILKERCFECHSHGTKIKGGLVLDSRSGWVEGGDNSRPPLSRQAARPHFRTSLW